MKYLKIHICLVLFVGLCHSAQAQSRFNRVRQHINTENAKPLLSFLDSCLFKNYQRDSALFFKGLVNLRINQTVEAIRYHKLLANEFPEFWEAHYLQGLIYYIQKRYHESIFELSQVLKKNPKDWRAYYDRALAFGQLDEANAAIEDLNHCIAIHPRFAAAYYSRAYYYESLGILKEAIRDYEHNIVLEPKNFEAYIGLAYVYQNQKNTSMACEVIQKAIQQGSQAALEMKVNFCKGD
ncbi:MAG: tetratricopeptide repeat protein [Bacteroidota bacterium]